jgi:hypothetical protein
MLAQVHNHSFKHQLNSFVTFPHFPILHWARVLRGLAIGLLTIAISELRGYPDNPILPLLSWLCVHISILDHVKPIQLVGDSYGSLIVILPICLYITATTFFTPFSFLQHGNLHLQTSTGPTAHTPSCSPVPHHRHPYSDPHPSTRDFA